MGEGVTETLSLLCQNRKLGGARCRLKAIQTNSIAAFVCVSVCVCVCACVCVCVCAEVRRSVL